MFDEKVRIKQATLTINPIRLNWHYVIWYKNFIVILLSLVVPFILLAYWNSNTLAVMIRRHRLAYRPALRSNDNARTNLAISLPTNEEVAAADNALETKEVVYDESNFSMEMLQELFLATQGVTNRSTRLKFRRPRYVMKKSKCF